MFQQLLEEYGLWVAVLIYVGLTVVPTINSIFKAMGMSSAVRAAASAVAVQSTAEASALASKAESDTQLAMVNITLQMLEERRVYGTQLSQVNDKLTGVLVELAGVKGELKASTNEYQTYRINQERETGLLQAQLVEAKALWTASDEAKKKLELEITAMREELKALREEIKVLQTAFEAAKDVSADRLQEINRLKEEKPPDQSAATMTKEKEHESA